MRKNKSLTENQEVKKIIEKNKELNDALKNLKEKISGDFDHPRVRKVDVPISDTSVPEV